MKDCTKKFHEEHPFNTTILESEHFKVIPSIGSIVEGWLLLIPKKHYISLCNLEVELFDELEILTQKTNSLLEQTFKKEVIIFENGAIEDKTLIGCGVDYAHLHFVPISLDIKNIIDKKYDSKLQWEKINNLRDIKFRGNKSPYYYIQNSKEKLYTNVEIAYSQIIRKGIANYVGKPLMFDWKKYSFEDNINNTINKLKSSITRNR